MLTRLFSRRGLLAAAGAVLLGGAAWHAFEYALDIERYRPLLTSELTEVIGLPVSIGEMDLQLFPIPHLAASTFVIGQDDFRLDATAVHARARLRPLIRKQLDITSIHAQQAILFLPEPDERLSQSVKAFLAHFEQSEDPPPKSGGGQGLKVEVEAISIGRLQVRRGGVLAAQGSIWASQPFSASPVLNARAAVPWLSPEASFNASVRFVETEGAPVGVQGSATLENYSANELLGLTQWPELTADLRAEISGVLPDELLFDCHATTTLSNSPSPLHGTLSGKTRWHSGTLEVTGAVLEAPGLRAAGEFLLSPGEAPRMHLSEGRAAPPALPVLLAPLVPESVALRTGEDAFIAVSALSMAFPPGGAGIGFESGAFSFGGFELATSGGTSVFTGIAGKGDCKEGVFDFAELACGGVHLAGTIQPEFAVGNATVDLRGEIELSREKAAPWAPPENIQELSGGVELVRLSGTFGQGEFPPPDLKVESRLRDVSVQLTAAGLSAPLDVDHVNGAIVWDAGSLRLDHVSAQGVTLHGALLRDKASGHVRLDLTGEIDLGSPLLSMALPPNLFSDLRGTATLQRIAGTFIPGEGVPADLVVDGAIAKGALTLSLPHQKETIKDIEARFTSAPGEIAGDLSLNLASMGPATWKGAYTRDNHTLEGVLWINLDQAATPFVPPGEGRAYLSAVLRAYGQSGLDIQARLPAQHAPGATFELRRQGEPALNGAATFAAAQGGLALDAVRIAADIPAEWLSQALPPRVAAEGMAQFEIRREARDARFNASLSLDNAIFTAGQYLHKPGGVPAAVRVQGSPTWTPEQIEIETLGQRLTFVPQGARWAAADLDIDLAGLTALLPPGASAGGRITGAISTNPVTAALRLDNARIALAPEIAIDSLDGLLAYRDGYWTCQNLRLLGAGSDCTMTAGFRGPTWHVDVNGAKLNLNALIAMNDAFSAFQENAAPPPAAGQESAAAVPKPGWKRAITGDIAMNIQEVLLRRATIHDVRADVAIQPGETTFDNLSMRLYSGALTGSIKWIPGVDEHTPGQAEIKASLDNADMRILDELLFAETRAITGAVSAQLDLRFPFGKNAEPFHGLNGSASFHAKDGSYGRMGFATRLLTLLKTTEILRLKLPSLSDKGLTFRSSSGVMSMKDGVMTIEAFTLTDKAYALEAKGTVDFPNDATNVQGRMHPLESVTGIVGGIPIIGDTLNLLKKTTGLPLYASGSPFEPVLRIEPAGKAGKEVKNAAESILKR